MAWRSLHLSGLQKTTVNLQVYNPLVHVAQNNLFDPISSGEIYKNAVPSRNYRHHHKHIELLMGLCFPVQNDMNNNSGMVREHEHNIVLNAGINCRHSPKSIERITTKKKTRIERAIRRVGIYLALYFDVLGKAFCR